ncbi:MAG: ASCH domain-containing protein [Muribaculaceae bacterium]
MKCLSIQQPWASLICGGIKDVENRSWRVNEAPGRILIHAGKTKRPIEELPIFYSMRIDNAVACGYVPEEHNMPLGAIIGYADITGFTEDCSSDWAQEGHGAEWKWQIENARLFKTPIPYRGRQGLFEVPEIDINNLPEVVDFPKVARNGSTLELPVSSWIFKQLQDLEMFNLYLSEENRYFFADENLEPIPTDSVIFIDAISGEKISLNVDNIVIQEEVEDDGNPIWFFDPNGNELYLYTVNIYYKR